MVRKKEEKKTREGNAMDVIPSHPCVVALANQTGARDGRQDELIFEPYLLKRGEGCASSSKFCFVVVIRPVVLQ